MTALLDFKLRASTYEVDGLKMSVADAKAEHAALSEVQRATAQALLDVQAKLEALQSTYDEAAASLAEFRQKNIAHRATIAELETVAAEKQRLLVETDKAMERTSAKLAARMGSKLAADIALAREIKHEQAQSAEIERLKALVANSSQSAASGEAEACALRDELAALAASAAGKESALLQAFEAERAVFAEQLGEQRKVADELTTELMDQRASEKKELLVANMKMFAKKSAADTAGAVASAELESHAVSAIADLKVEAVQLQVSNSRYREQVGQLELALARHRDGASALEAERAAATGRIGTLEAANAELEKRSREMHALLAEQSASLEQRTHESRAAVAELAAMSTVQVREAEARARSASPRFARSALAIIRREEQLQRTKEVLRSQRATNQAALESVRSQLSSYEGPHDQVYAALIRMEEQHVRANQQWEYKRECLLQERTRLQELSMQAFCKVVYVDRGWRQGTLIEGISGEEIGKDLPQSAYPQFDKEASISSPLAPLRPGRASPPAGRSASPPLGW